MANYNLLILIRQFSLISATVRTVFRSIKYVVVKTLIEQKTAHFPNQKAPVSNLGNLPPCWEPMTLRFGDAA